MQKPVYLFYLLLLILSACQPLEHELTSPDGKLELSFALDAENNNAPVYRLEYEGQVLLKPSTLGFNLENGQDWSSGFNIRSVDFRENNSSWEPVYGEKTEIPDRYREMTVQLAREANEADQLEIIFRLYDEGLAYRYRLASNGNEQLTVQREHSAFSFLADHQAWTSDRAQSEIGRSRISELRGAKERPLVLSVHDSLYVALGEAGLVDFARMKLSADSLQAHTIVADLAGEATVQAPYATPWRYVMIGKSPGELLEKNYFLLNLNEPNAIEDVSWIRPGKVIREVTLTTQGGLACVDFAAANGLQYVEFDAGWYGPEYEESSDARTVTVDPKRSPGPLDLPQVVEYAQTKDIGIILYVNRRALEQQLDEILPLFRSWGIKGVKYGFVQVGSQEWTRWLHEAVQKAADNQLMIDIHDEYRPTGYSRTYPNLMTQEGIRGDEESPSTAHTLTTLFTRMIAGAGDNTICYYAPRVTEKMGGHAAQLAKAVMLYSPWQFLYWYDRPEGSPHQKGGAGASTGIIADDPELAFFANIPTAWDDTKVIEGAIGRYATIARRSGEEWFVGSLAAEDRTVSIPLRFLEDGRSYQAIIYTHDPQSPSATKVGIEQQTVRSGSSLSFRLEKDRGLAIRIFPIE